jgi:hypothetical protein
VQFEIEQDGKRYSVKFFRVLGDRIKVSDIKVWDERRKNWRKVWNSFDPKPLRKTLLPVEQMATWLIEAKLAGDPRFPLMD